MVFHSAMNCPLLQRSPWYCTLFLTAFLSEYSGRFGFLRLKSGTYVRSQCLQALEQNRNWKMAGTTEEKPEPVGRSIFLDESIFVILKHLFCRTFNVLEKGLFVLGFPESRQNRWVPTLPSDVTKSLTHKKFRQTVLLLVCKLIGTNTRSHK